MTNDPVVAFDSGVGGLPYARTFRELAPLEDIVYIADNLNFPYGPKSKPELERVLVDLVGRIEMALHPKLLLVACNTASVSALPALRSAFPRLPIVGTVPAVKPAALSSRSGKIGVLATERTVNDPYVDLLMERFAPDRSLVRVAAPELVEFVEKRYRDSTPEQRAAIARPYVDEFRAKGVDALVLGCTHFLFLAPEFAEACGPDIALFDSRRGVAKRVAAVLEEHGEARRENSRPESIFLATADGPALATLGGFAPLFGLEFGGLLDRFRLEENAS